MKEVQGTNSCKYNEGNVTDVCFKCLMKPYRTFNLVFGWIWPRKRSHWENWIPVAAFDICSLAKCYWHSSMLDWSNVCIEIPSEKTHTKNCLVLLNPYYVTANTLMQKWKGIQPDKCCKIKIEKQNECRTGKCNFEYQGWIEKRQYYKACYDYGWDCRISDNVKFYWH